VVGFGCEENADKRGPHISEATRVRGEDLQWRRDRLVAVTRAQHARMSRAQGSELG
jgi:hypothetical protein